MQILHDTCILDSISLHNYLLHNVRQQACTELGAVGADGHLGETAAVDVSCSAVAEASTPRMSIRGPGWFHLYDKCALHHLAVT